MGETLLLPVSDLLLDGENPRLPQPNVGQREIQRELSRLLQGKLYRLAQDIVTHGLNPADLIIVMPFDKRRYVVLEGNRRLVALKALENPDSLVGALTPSITTQLRKLSAEYQENPIDAIDCIVVKDRDEARHWIELRHAGQKEGAGIVPWGADDVARFRARTGDLEPSSQILDFLESKGELTPEKRRQVPAASLGRLISTPEVREKLGINIRDKNLQIIGDEKKVAKVLTHVVNDLASKKTVTKDIYTKEQRVQYADAIPKRLVVPPPTEKNNSTKPPSSSISAKPKRSKLPKSPRQRDILIPHDCVLNITTQRIQYIEGELRILSLEKHTNAVSVLLRVFIELSCDSYIDRFNISMTADKTLSAKINGVKSDLVNRQKLSADQARVVSRAAQRDSFLAPSITLLNGYVHNQHSFPAPGDVRAHWDNLQPFLIAIWSS